MMSYPDYQALPRSIKKMLVASESFFFGEARPRTQKPAQVALTARVPLKTTLESDFAAQFSS